MSDTKSDALSMNYFNRDSIHTLGGWDAISYSDDFLCMSMP